MFNHIKQNLTHNLLNLPGWSTKRKIVVIESDDWGSIRMTSKDSYQYFLNKGYPVDKCPYNRFDALECNKDLELLFEVLSSVKDKNEHPAIFTANHIVANPNFNKIKESYYNEYSYESFPETLKHFPQHERVFDLYKEGIERMLFMPQFHGREHVNVKRWMRSLIQGNQASLDAFEHQMFSVHQPYDPGNKNEFMDALDFDSEDDSNYLDSLVVDGLNLFDQIWGFSSKSFIASCYIWHSSLEKTLSAKGVNYIKGMAVQNEPIAGKGTFRYIRHYHYQGQKNKYGQRYLIRNAFFEPSHNPSFDWVNDCLKRIEISFRWHKPAIISSHRVNYMGSIDPSNREKNLKSLTQLLFEILKKWPDVEFLSTNQLGEQMSEKAERK